MLQNGLHCSSSSPQDSQCTYNVTLRRVPATIVGVASNKYLHIPIVYVALRIQHAVRMRHIDKCGLPSFTVFFFKFSHKRHNLLKPSY